MSTSQQKISGEIKTELEVWLAKEMGLILQTSEVFSFMPPDVLISKLM